jgi:predicted RNA-binding protein with PIN domain
LADAEHALENSRRVVRDGRTTESVRSRLLVDTMVDAAQGLRRELALPPVHTRPADLVTGTGPGVPAPAGSRGRDTDDPVLLEELLALPQVHLIVDGYNVTKTGYGDLPLEDQRGRLVTALGSLAARTQAEITCVFDGAELHGPGVVPSARHVRVRFSPAGVIADDVIRDLVSAEPPGRPVVVVTNDAEVLRDVRRAGAWTAGSLALLRMLGAR